VKVPKQPDHLQDTLRRIQIDRADRSPAHQMSFDLVPATCVKVGEAMNALHREIEDEYGIKPEDAVALDLAIHRAIARIKETATEPLRRALIYASSEAITGRDLYRKYKAKANEHNRQ
jgi:hypothetical protein